MRREENCLPRRIKAVLARVNDGDFSDIGRMIGESEACPHRDHCEVATACLRIHRAFLPLVPVPAT